MAARRALMLLDCLSCSRRSNKFLGIFTRNFSDARVLFSRQPPRRQSCYGTNIARSMCSSQSALDFIDKDITSPTKKDADDTDSTSSLSQNELLKQINIFDTDEKVEIPKAADSHMTSSMLDDELVNKFVNCMMWGGKKSLSQKIFKLAMEEIKKEQLKKQRQSSQPDSVETDPLQIFATAIENCKPVIGVVGMKRAGTVYQVPSAINQRRRRFLAIKWLIKAAREQQKGSARMYKKLAKELMDAYNKEGTVINRKHELHKRAEENRAYAHFRWW
ncbi:small ribosomal subunit protein uS7 isoform X2 [Pocillopora verrucosa]|uniref:small ribosomal subunit protein uS7 isoform X2 n=1 Tax=Pocillopora verrucosa TaxID=203993 RepID=UPI0033401E4E